MSIYGLKPLFKDQEGYRAWRGVYKNVYQDISDRIRASKRVLRGLHKMAGSGSLVSQAAKKLHGERVAARKLNTVLDEAKKRMAQINDMKKDLLEHQAQFPLVIEDAKNVDFHFNKKHLEFSWIPMWVVKAKGQSYYVHHVDATAPWTTKESPDHPSTKGAIRVKRCNIMIDAEGVAHLTAINEPQMA